MTWTHHLHQEHHSQKLFSWHILISMKMHSSFRYKKEKHAFKREQKITTERNGYKNKVKVLKQRQVKQAVYNAISFKIITLEGL